MAKRENLGLVAVRTDGAILPPSVLHRIHSVDEKLGGLKPEDFGLSGTRVREAASQAWSALQGPWLALKAKREEGSPDLGPTRAWVRQILRALHYGDLDLRDRNVDDEGRSFKMSALYSDHLPLFVVGHRQDLDKRNVDTRLTPHGNLQILLNTKDAYLWGFVTNGLQWRILRDSISLSRQAMVEIDLETIFDGGLYDEFLLFFLVCHQSRVKADKAADCWLEKWSLAATEEGKRALDTLRNGVQKAIEALGQGFLQNSGNARLRERLRSGELDKQDYYRQLLRLVYRLLFLFVAEDRDLLSNPQATDSQRQLYRDAYSTQRLRILAERLRGAERHHDQYVALKLVLSALGEPLGCAELAIAPLGGLFKRVETPDLDSAEISNFHLQEAVRFLAVTREGGRRARVDYKNLGSEELGSVYESLLELHPELSADGSKFELRSASGNERKTTGSYYTPDSLIQCLLDTALDPVVAETVRTARSHYAVLDGESPEAQAILNLKILDPAVGSGHFLIASAHRLSRALAKARTGDEEPSPTAIRKALRDVIGRCLYGVDLNPMAAELCKVALWMEAMEPGKPLAFLDHHIQVGNSLLGATPELIADGIPDAAYDAVPDPVRRAELKKQNRAERRGVRSLFIQGLSQSQRKAARLISQLESGSDEDLNLVDAKERRYEDLLRDREFTSRFTAADLWAASFSPTAYDVFSAAAAGLELTTESVLRSDELHEDTLMLVRHFREQFRFFHFHLAFPDVFENQGGFDVVLGNPPWERVKLQEREFFAARAPEIANAPNAAARKRLIDLERQRDTRLWKEFKSARDQAEAEARMLTKSGKYPLAGRGDVNTFAVFAELKRSLVRPGGRVGMILPSGIATDDTTKFFFQNVVECRSLVSLFDFQSGPGLWSEIGHARFKFCLLTMTGANTQVKYPARFSFFLRDVAHLDDNERVFELSAKDFELVNPNTRTCPVFRTRRDAEITKDVYGRVPVLIRDGHPDGNPWQATYQRMFDMSNDSESFRTREELEMASGCPIGNVWTVPTTVIVGGRAVVAGKWHPLFEAKMIHHFDHRWATYQEIEASRIAKNSVGVEARDTLTNEKQDPHFSPSPRYWVLESEVDRASRTESTWFFGFRDICRSTDVRTAIGTVLPRSGAGNKLPLLHSKRSPLEMVCFCANFCSFALDYVARQKIGGTQMTLFYLKQLPLLVPRIYAQECPWQSGVTLLEWIVPRVLELTYVSYDMKALALELGFDGDPFTWNEPRRFLLKAELDAAFFHLYGIPRHDLDHVLDSFHIIRQNDVAAYGCFRTKDTILEVFDEMAVASRLRVRKGTSIPPSFPSNENEQAMVALAYAVIKRVDGATDPDVLQAALLAQHSELCRGLLSADHRMQYDIDRAASQQQGVSLPPGTLNWAECRSYLEVLDAIRVDRDGDVQRIHVLQDLPETLAGLARGLARDAEFGCLALEQIRKGVHGTQGAAEKLVDLVAGSRADV